jgi:hypothetical protein
MIDLIERLRHHSVNAHQVKEIDVVYLHELFGRSANELEANELEAKDKRIAKLESENRALRHHLDCEITGGRDAD